MDGFDRYWFGFPTSSPYWWDNNREEPKRYSTPTDAQLLVAWDTVRGTVDVPEGLSVADAWSVAMDLASETVPKDEVKPT